MWQTKKTFAEISADSAEKIQTFSFGQKFENILENPKSLFDPGSKTWWILWKCISHHKWNNAIEIDLFEGN